MQTHSARLDLQFETILPSVRDTAASLEVPFAETDDGIALMFEDGSVSLNRDTGASRLTLEAQSQERLAALHEIVAYYVASYDIAERVEWQSGRASGRPANLTLATVASNERLSPSFQRIRLKGDFARFKDGGLHFRLIFGPEGADWPHCDATGATIWPDGIDAWHRPPYTVRAIAPDHSWIDVDIFRHDGGRVTNWATKARIGDTVGLTGPGGKGPKRARWIAYLGDETALPVIARMLETLSPATQGVACIFVSDPMDRQKLTHPVGVDLQWHLRGETEPLSVLKSLAPPAADRFVFFAGERQDSVVAREHLESIGFERGEFLAAAYWTDN